MSSSGLIYAVIVGAWAAYLVPMWLRRQDELNEARPTERFSTAIRLLSGRAAMERRISRSLGDRTDGIPDGVVDGASGMPAGPAPDDAPAPDASRPGPAGAHPAPALRPTQGQDDTARATREARIGAERRALLLARRRRMVTLLFFAFTLGAIVAGVGGLAFLWVPALPAVLLSLYIARLRRQERLRYEVKLDRRHAAEAAQRLHERERHREQAHQPHQAHQTHPPHQPRRPARPHDAAYPGDRGHPAPRIAAHPDRHRVQPPQQEAAASEDSVPAPVHSTDPMAERQALVEATDHEEWVDGLRERSADPDSWEPVPVPLPTYVTAPVAPRSTGSLDLNAPDAWSAGRTAVPPAAPQIAPAPQSAPAPLFDQYADDDAAEPRPRAANE